MIKSNYLLNKILNGTVGLSNRSIGSSIKRAKSLDVFMLDGQKSRVFYLFAPYQFFISIKELY